MCSEAVKRRHLERIFLHLILKWHLILRWDLHRNGLNEMNGTLFFSFFPTSRGLSEGVPLSPYLFVIVIEVLNFQAKRVRKEFYVYFLG